MMMPLMCSGGGGDQSSLMSVEVRGAPEGDKGAAVGTKEKQHGNNNCEYWPINSYTKQKGCTVEYLYCLQLTILRSADDDWSRQRTRSHGNCQYSYHIHIVRMKATHCETSLIRQCLISKSYSSIVLISLDGVETNDSILSVHPWSRPGKINRPGQKIALGYHHRRCLRGIFWSGQGDVDAEWSMAHRCVCCYHASVGNKRSEGADDERGSIRSNLNAAGTNARRNVDGVVNYDSIDIWR